MVKVLYYSVTYSFHMSRLLFLIIFLVIFSLCRLLTHSHTEYLAIYKRVCAQCNESEGFSGKSPDGDTKERKRFERKKDCRRLLLSSFYFSMLDYSRKIR